MGAIADFAVHIVAARTKSKYVGAAIGVGFERLVGFFGEINKVKDATFTTSDFSDDVVAPDDKAGEKPRDN